MNRFITTLDKVTTASLPYAHEIGRKKMWGYLRSKGAR